MKRKLTLTDLKVSARDFAVKLSKRPLSELYGITDGKAVGTYVEHSFHDFLKRRFSYNAGSSASGIDFPGLGVDLKVTSMRQPQSSCPYRSAEQKVYGLGYHLMVMVYEKKDDKLEQVARLNIRNVIFVAKEKTADYQTTRGLLEILDRDGNKDDLIAFLEERNLPLDDLGRDRLAERIIKDRPVPGYLTISNALQWRLQYSRIVQIAEKGGEPGVENLLQQSKGRQ